MWKCISYSCFARDYTEVFEMCVNKFLFLDFFLCFLAFINSQYYWELTTCSTFFFFFTVTVECETQFCFFVFFFKWIVDLKQCYSQSRAAFA